MAADNLTELVRRGVPQGEVHLIPVIEKELIHYDVLAALDKLGLIEKLVFHGGTCLRLCYGAQRRSEDLDFAYAGDLEALDLSRLEGLVSSSLQEKFGLSAIVRPPRRTVQFATAKMQRWWMVVNTAPERPDLPSQKLKIELVSVRTLTRSVRRVSRNYDYLAPSAGNMLVVCEAREEILADKMVSFVNTPPTYMRKRDIWDMFFLLSQHGVSREGALAMVADKMAIYGCGLSAAEFADEGASRVGKVAESPDFAKEMLRFMTREAYEGMLGTETKRLFAIEEVRELYRMVSRGV